MKKAGLLLLSLTTITLLVVSCYYDKEELLYPQLNTVCDTTNVTFTKNIVPILSNYCWSCHSNANAAASGSNFKLENYSDVKAMLERVYNSVTHQSAYPMPKNSGMLNTCIITQFTLWKNNGAPQ